VKQTKHAQSNEDHSNDKQDIARNDDDPYPCSSPSVLKATPDYSLWYPKHLANTKAFSRQDPYVDIEDPFAPYIDPLGGCGVPEPALLLKLFCAASRACD
jgi:hypothetical protein